MSSSIFMADRIDLLCFGLICTYVVLVRFVVFGSIVVFRIDFVVDRSIPLLAATPRGGAPAS